MWRRGIWFMSRRFHTPSSIRESRGTGKRSHNISQGHHRHRPQACAAGLPRAFRQTRLPRSRRARDRLVGGPQFSAAAGEEPPPDHSTISRTRRAIDLESHRAVFTWVQQRLVAAGLLKGKTIAIDATTLEANAAMRSIVRRDTEES